jgi:hypothetical protein
MSNVEKIDRLPVAPKLEASLSYDNLPRQQGRTPADGMGAAGAGPHSADGCDGLR